MTFCYIKLNCNSLSVILAILRNGFRERYSGSAQLCSKRPRITADEAGMGSEVVFFAYFFEGKCPQKWSNSVIWNIGGNVFRFQSGGNVRGMWGARCSKNRSFFEGKCPQKWSDSVIWKVRGDVSPADRH